MLVYLAHPVGQDGAERIKNIANVQKWFLFLLKNTDWALSVPWLIYVQNLTESPENHKRGLHDDLENLSKCDAIVLTGGKISAGMATELGLALMSGMKVIDLTSCGYSPEEWPERALEILCGTI